MRVAARAIFDLHERDEAEREAVDTREMPVDGDDAIPPTWTAEHLAKRLVEAFITLAHLPSTRGPRRPGNHWPQHVYEWADLLAQAEMSEKEKARRRRASNTVRLMPTGEDIRRMDVMLGWLSDLARAQPEHARVLQRWAVNRSRRRSVVEECRAAGIGRTAYYARKLEAVTALLTLLSRLDAAPVW